MNFEKFNIVDRVGLKEQTIIKIKLKFSCNFLKRTTLLVKCKQISTKAFALPRPVTFAICTTNYLGNLPIVDHIASLVFFIC